MPADGAEITRAAEGAEIQQVNAGSNLLDDLNPLSGRSGVGFLALNW